MLLGEENCFGCTGGKFKARQKASLYLHRHSKFLMYMQSWNRPESAGVCCCRISSVQLDLVHFLPNASHLSHLSNLGAYQWGEFSFCATKLCGRINTQSGEISPAVPQLILCTVPQVCLFCAPLCAP